MKNCGNVSSRLGHLVRKYRLRPISVHPLSKIGQLLCSVNDDLGIGIGGSLDL